MAKSQLEKLKEIAAQENKLVKHEIELKGQDMTFWTRPLTITELQMVKKECKDPTDQLESTARLFIQKALDQSGVQQFTKEALPIMLRGLSLASATALMNAMAEDEDEDGLDDLDMKSPKA